jgi:hypothetical protein
MPDQFYTQFLTNFIRQCIWGIGDMSMSNILAGKASWNWLQQDKEPETMLSVLVDNGYFGEGGKHVKTHWKYGN